MHSAFIRVDYEPFLGNIHEIPQTLHGFICAPKRVCKEGMANALAKGVICWDFSIKKVLHNEIYDN